MGCPMFSLETSPRLMRPGSNVSVSRWKAGSQSSWSRQKHAGQVVPGRVEQMDPASGLAATHRRGEEDIQPELIAGEHIAGRIHARHARERCRWPGWPVEHLFDNRSAGRPKYARDICTPGANGKRGTNSRVWPVTAYEPASGGTSPVPAYTANTEGQPFGGAVAGAFHPATLNVRPSSWMETVWAMAVTSIRKMSAMAGREHLRKIESRAARSSAD